MRHFLILAIILLLPLYAASQYSKTVTANVSAISQFEMNEDEKENISEVITELVTRYYNFNPQNYLQNKMVLIPKLTENYKTVYLENSERNRQIIESTDWSSKVNRFRILAIRGGSETTASALFDFEAEVKYRGQVSTNRYRTIVQLKKVNGSWLIDKIENETPTELNVKL